MTASRAPASQATSSRIAGRHHLGISGRLRRNLHLSRYFDSIPHNELLKSVARRVADGSVLRLIKLWLKAPIEERDADGTRRMSGGKGNTRGTPQGGVAS